ncbi:ATP-binding protein [Peptoniphilaceae bacterium SGI.137]|nr:ATP-binding protein [Peptoniphilaceae bacterium]MCI6659893.1 ATP-binding protein [Peptoniphilaceae bacterium]MDY5841906.1 ATP-binding protein [Peptoniphilaceae bacterium]
METKRVDPNNTTQEKNEDKKKAGVNAMVPVREGEAKKKSAHSLSDTLGFKIMGIFSAIILVVTIVFQIFYIRSLYSYFYDSVAGALSTQAKYNADLYLSYLSDEDLYAVVNENKNQFYRTNSTQVQILSNRGTVLYDSIGSEQIGTDLSGSDVQAAQAGDLGTYIGVAPHTNEGVMSVARPLRSQTEQVGIIRLTTSLSGVNRMIQKRILISMGFSLVAIVLTFLLSYLVSRSIINPLKKLTRVALQYVDGKYTERADETIGGEIGALARTMNEMSDSILQKEKLKNEFISSVSHELRTPLTSIKGWAITLQSEGMDPELMQEGLQIIEKESDRLGSMVEELLDFSRFTYGRFRLNKQRFNLVDAINHILSQFRIRTEEKKIDIVYRYEDPNIEIFADPDRIKQVFLNILDNAIKFTNEEGTIFIELGLQEEKAVLTVTDTGIGISEDEIGFVTEKFWKGSSSQSHTGLGLSICEEIVKAHGGVLQIKSKLNAGTTVRVELPRTEES